MQLFADLYDAIVAFPKPTIAACHGDVVGGGAEIAVACDMRVGGSNLRMRFPGAALGVPVGPARLVTLCGLAAAKYLLLTSRTVGADEALRLGLVNRVAPAAATEESALELAASGRRPPTRGGRPPEADAARVGRRRGPLRRRGRGPGRVAALRAGLAVFELGGSASDLPGTHEQSKVAPSVYSAREDALKLLASVLLVLGCLLVAPTAAMAVTYTVDSIEDEEDALPGTGGCLTLGGKCTLRAAIEESNFSAGTRDEIKFAAAFDGQPADTIILLSALPGIEDPVSILGGDCFGEDGPDAPCAGIKGPSGAAALTVEDADGVAIVGLAITGAQFGIDVVGGSEGFVARNDWIGLNLSAAKEANLTGIFLDPGSDGATIGGLAASERNVIAGNEGDGLDLNGASNATIAGNYFGVNPPEPVGLPGGSQQMANGKDIEITDSTSGGGVKAESNEVGATIEGAALINPACDGGCNVISGANGAGIDLNGDGAGQNEAPASGPTLVDGNFIGVSASGTGTVANGSYGVFAGHADNVTVGEFPLGDANYLAGSSEAIATEEGESFIARGNSFGVGPGGAELTRPGKAILALDQGVTVPPNIELNLILAGSIGIEQIGKVGHLTANEVIGGSIGIYARGEPGGGLVASNFIEAASENGILVDGPDNEVRGNTVLESGKAGIRFKNPPGIAMTGGLIGGSTGEKENVIEGSGGPAIEILEEALEPGSVTEIARNRGSANKGLFIDLVNGAADAAQPRRHRSDRCRGVRAACCGRRGARRSVTVRSCGRLRSSWCRGCAITGRDGSVTVRPRQTAIRGIRRASAIAGASPHSEPTPTCRGSRPNADRHVPDVYRCGRRGDAVLRIVVSAIPDRVGGTIWTQRTGRGGQRETRRVRNQRDPFHVHRQSRAACVRLHAVDFAVRRLRYTGRARPGDRGVGSRWPGIDAARRVRIQSLVRVGAGQIRRVVAIESAVSANGSVACVALDAMGVLFRAADDVAELLIPFVRNRGGVEDAGAIQSAYVDASLGAITADAFWRNVGLRPSLEDEYLSGHALMPGAPEVLRLANDSGVPVWVLSNDVERWSRKLRNSFAIERWLSGSVISSDATARKPDAAIYRYFLRRSGYAAEQVLFVDDREKNVVAADALRIRSLQFNADSGFSDLTDELRGRV